MDKSKLVPICVKEITISKFDDENYYVHQTKFNYRLKISNDSYKLLILADGLNSLFDINEIELLT